MKNAEYFAVLIEIKVFNSANLTKKYSTEQAL